MEARIRVNYSGAKQYKKINRRFHRQAKVVNVQISQNQEAHFGQLVNRNLINKQKTVALMRLLPEIKTITPRSFNFHRTPILAS